ncbi:unnamed protein product [Schistosoma turkestanicum]|nr:unnamed protein product [Schistosoma turkestanicum]
MNALILILCFYIGGYRPSFHLHNTGDSCAISELQRQCLDSVLSQFIRIAPPLLPCPQGTDEISYNLNEDDESISRTVFDFSPSGKRPIKKSKPIYNWSEELIWLNPNIVEHDFHWNSSMELVDMTVEVIL